MSSNTEKLPRNLNIIVWVLAIAIPTVVTVLLTPGLLPRITLPFDAHLLPPFHATINATTALLLLLALYFIKKKDIKSHQRAMTVAMILSVVFLVSYVLYHWAVENEARYGDINHDLILSDEEKASAGFVRYIYYFVLSSHILLSAVVVPLVLFSFLFGYRNMVERHRKIVKYSFPLWLYVAITGVITYIMVSPYYPG